MSKQVLLSIVKGVGAMSASLALIWVFSIAACDDGREDVCGVVTEIEVDKYVHAVYIRRGGITYECYCNDADLRNFSVGDSACARCYDGCMKSPSNPIK